MRRRRMAQIVHSFEQRRDIQRHMSAVVDELRAPRQRQHGEHVGRAARHADDVQADRLRAVGVARVGELIEYRIEHVAGRVGGFRQFASSPSA